MINALLLAVLAADGGTDNYLNCRVTQATNTDGTTAWTVVVAAPTLAPNASTASKQPAFSTPGSPSRDTLSVQGVPFMTPIKVDASGVVVPVAVQSSPTLNLGDAGVLNVNPVAIASAPTLNIGDAGVLNVNPIAIASAPTLNIGDAGVLNVNFPVTQQISATNLDVALSTRTKPSDQQHVIIDTAAPTLPLPSGAATDATLSGLFDGGVVAQGQLPSGASRPIALTEEGAIWVRQLPSTSLLLPCNPVRRTNCR